MDKYFAAGRTILDFATKGGLLAAGGAMAVFTVATLLDWMRQPPADRLWVVLGNYFVTGALVGGLVGLAVVLWGWWQQRRQES